MSTELNQPFTQDDIDNLPVPNRLQLGIVVARWNSKVTDALLKGALSFLERAGYPADDHTVVHVPGTIELVHAAARLLKDDEIDGVIVIGCVIRGDTPHFDYVCQHVTQGCAILNAQGTKPVIFGVLTTDNEQQALDRAGGRLGNKGCEAAAAAIEMVAFDQEHIIIKYDDDDDYSIY